MGKGAPVHSAGVTGTSHLLLGKTPAASHKNCHIYNLQRSSKWHDSGVGGEHLPGGVNQFDHFGLA